MIKAVLYCCCPFEMESPFPSPDLGRHGYGATDATCVFAAAIHSANSYPDSGAPSPVQRRVIIPLSRQSSRAPSPREMTVAQVHSPASPPVLQNSTPVFVGQGEAVGSSNKKAPNCPQPIPCTSCSVVLPEDVALPPQVSSTSRTLSARPVFNQTVLEFMLERNRSAQSTQNPL